MGKGYEIRRKMKKILIVSGHPDLENSTANRTIIENLSKKLPEVTIHRLDKIIKNGNFNIEKEQALLLEYDTYIFVSPFYWYSWSALMKKWVDNVFNASLYKTGKVKGKNVVFSFTTGGPAEIYSHDGLLKHTVEELTLSISTIAVYTGMNTLGYAISNDMQFEQEIHGNEKLEEISKKAEKHADKIIELVK